MDETWRRELSEFIAIPSVSAEPAHGEDVKRAGEWVCDFIRRIGGTAELTPFGEHELALGEIPASSDPDDAPTVLCYGHFDVQPPAPLELWDTDPFELTIKDEWAYARGVTDDKGQVFILLKAAQKLIEANALPVNLRFACDGEEEIGGQTIVDYLAVDDQGADAGIIFDGGMLRVRRRRDDRRARPPLGYVRRRRIERGARSHALLRRRDRATERLAAGAASRGNRSADGG